MTSTGKDEEVKQKAKELKNSAEAKGKELEKKGEAKFEAAKVRHFSKPTRPFGFLHTNVCRLFRTRVNLKSINIVMKPRASLRRVRLRLKLLMTRHAERSSMP